MSSDHPEIVIVRRRSALEDAHHGGAWKIAFADFMTAMMAFFLVLWIISATDKNTKTIIARYFNPVKVEEPARSQKGIHGQLDPNMQAAGNDSSGAPNNATKTPADQNAPGQSPVETPEATPKDVKNSHPDKHAQPDPARPMPTMTEDELFSDPLASLDRISGAPPAGAQVEPASAPATGDGDERPSAGDSYLDPFRPLGGRSEIRAPATTDSGADGRDERSATPSGSAGDTASQGQTTQEAQQQRPPNQETAKPGLPISDAKASPELAVSPSRAGAPLAQTGKGPPDVARARALLADLKKRLDPETRSAPGPELDVQATDEGILISLTDRENFSMFAIGSAEPQRRVVRMMEAIATSLKALPGTIVVRGHTDAHPYRSKRYDNWRLSSARAQMAFYMLNRAGVPDKRFERIEGFADHRLKDAAKPFAAENRRIEILVREAKP